MFNNYEDFLTRCFPVLCFNVLKYWTLIVILTQIVWVLHTITTTKAKPLFFSKASLNVKDNAKCSILIFLLCLWLFKTFYLDSHLDFQFITAYILFENFRLLSLQSFENNFIMYIIKIKPFCFFIISVKWLNSKA